MPLFYPLYHCVCIPALPPTEAAATLLADTGCSAVIEGANSPCTKAVSLTLAKGNIGEIIPIQEGLQGAAPGGNAKKANAFRISAMHGRNKAGPIFLLPAKHGGNGLFTLF